MKSQKENLFDVIVIGAGVLGTSLAYHLGKQGIKVCVVEREPFVAAHASGKNAGMIRQLYRNPQLTDWCKRSIESWPEEARAHFIQTGSLILGRTIPSHHSEIFSQLSTANKTDAVYCSSDGLLDSPSYVESLKQLSLSFATKYLFHTRVNSLIRDTTTWRVELDSGCWLSAPWVANCSGAWLNSPLAETQSEQMLSAQAYARYLFLVDGWKSETMPEKDCGFYWDEQNSWYMRKWDKTARLISVCDKLPVSSPEDFIPNTSSMERLASTLLKALPDQAQNLSIRKSWHCFRTYCEDQLPIWGEDPNVEGLFWLAAFGGFGMSTSFSACEDAAEAIINNNSKIYPEFCPSRVRQISQESPFKRGQN